MCHFLTVTAGGVRDAAALEQWAGQCGLGWTLVENPTVSPLLLRGELYVSSTRSHCDCGTDLGLLSRLSPVQTVSERDLAALRKKGWSATRIERWRSEKQSSQQRSRERDSRIANEGSAAQHWSKFIREALDQKLAEWVGILLHWYRHGVENENLSALVTEWFPIQQVTYEFLREAHEDVLYRFSNRPDTIF